MIDNLIREMLYKRNQAIDKAFIVESNKIEGITREPTWEEHSEFERFINLPKITVDELIRFVNVYQPNARLRDKDGLNVRAVNHSPPAGHPKIKRDLSGLLRTFPDRTPYDLHCKYESLHPFTDCNGRSGRALWAWHMNNRGEYIDLGFLHTFYYQSLDYSRA